MSGISNKEHIRNEVIRQQVKVVSIPDKMREQWLRWYGHVERREADYVGRRVQRLEVKGKCPRGKPKRRWLENEDMQKYGIDKSMAQDRKIWWERCGKANPI